jgi:hypothetical protein
MSDASTADKISVSAASLGAPGRPDPARCSLTAIEALSRIAGPDMAITSLQLDVSSRALGGGQAEILARVDKRTRSILFASVEANLGGKLVFKAQALFSRRGS